ncbi:MAG: DMT family transporter [Bacteroidota bacterium]
MNIPFKEHHYFKAVVWFVTALFIGCLNDAIAQYLSAEIEERIRLEHYTIAFYRLAISTVSLLPSFLLTNRKKVMPRYPLLHLLRGVLTFLGLFLWISGIGKSSIITATLVNFTMPIFAFLCAPFFLGEQRDWTLTIATSFGFIGTFITLYPAGIGIDAYSTFFMIAMGCFLSLDILAKKYEGKESLLGMLFYANVVAACCASLPFYFFVYQGALPAKQTWPWLAIIGVGGNLLLYCLLKAYHYAEMMRLAPLRYLEIVISLLLNYGLFQQTPTLYECVGALVIIPSSFWFIRKTHAD